VCSLASRSFWNCILAGLLTFCFFLLLFLLSFVRPSSILQWLAQAGSRLHDKISMGLEAAAILLFVINSPGIDRSVINEDAIEASIVFFRHHLAKNILPALNQVGHITNAGGTAENRADASRTPSTSAKKRRRSSAANGEHASVLRDMKKIYKPVYSTIGLTVQILERLEALVQKVPLDDQPLLNISSGAFISLELDPALQSDMAIAHQIHEASIGVVTAIFRKYSRHRQIIIEDLFPVMLKLPAYKKSMRTYPIQSSSIVYPTGLKTLSQSLAPGVEVGAIQTISAMILSLVQSSVVRPELQSEQQQQDQEEQEDERVPAPKRFEIVSGLRNSQSVSDLFVAHLLGRCSKKGEDGGASEFRPILSNLIDDLLLVLLVPEYPAAEMLLISIANGITRHLQELCNSKTANVETTYVNTVLDAFGKICAAEAKILKFHRERPVRIRSHATSSTSEERCYCDKDDSGVAMECGRCQSKYHSICVAMTKETVLETWYCDACQLGRIVDFEQERNANLGDLGCSPDLVDESYCMRRLLIDYLSIVTRNSGVAGFQDAYKFHLARWLSDLNRAHKRVGDNNVWPLVTRLTELWDPRESSDLNTHGQNSLNGMLHCLSDEGRSRIMVHVACTQSQLLLSHLSQLGLFVNELMGNKFSALLRRLSLKAIERVSWAYQSHCIGRIAGLLTTNDNIVPPSTQITDADPKLMVYPKVRNAVTARFSDEAISVREAAVSLVGLYVVHSPAVANAFHPAFMVALRDPGTSVRKRTIKILQDILCTNPSYKGRAEACTAMLSLAADPKEDDPVRDAIHDLFLKVWLEKGEETVEQEAASPGSPEVELTSPGGKVLDLEFANAAGDMVPVTPTPQLNDALSPPPTVRETRSTERRTKKRRLQVRSEIAAEQMVEVVKAADTGEHLTILFRDLLAGESDADKGRKTSARRKRRTLAEGHCSMLVDAIFEILLRVEENRSNAQGATSKDVVAVIRTIGVFTNISPNDVHGHLDTLLPYLKADNGIPFNQEAVVVASLCDAVARVAPVLSKDELDELSTTSLAGDLVKITYKFGREALSSAVRALSALAYHRESSENSPYRANTLSLAKTFYGYLLKHRDEEDFASMKVRIIGSRSFSGKFNSPVTSWSVEQSQG
jgi:cohesin loading factor subunit SCC2